MEKRLKQALRQLPDSKELPGLLTDVSSLGKNAGLEFKAFRPRDEIAKDFYAEVPIEIEFSGDFHDIARFFDKVSKLPRIVNVSQLEMEIAGQEFGSTRLKVHGEATTFRFLEHDVAAGGARQPQEGGTPLRRRLEGSREGEAPRIDVGSRWRSSSAARRAGATRLPCRTTSRSAPS